MTSNQEISLRQKQNVKSPEDQRKEEPDCLIHG
jgi:hypothetical protein